MIYRQTRSFQMDSSARLRLRLRIRLTTWLESIGNETGCVLQFQRAETETSKSQIYITKYFHLATSLIRLYIHAFMRLHFLIWIFFVFDDDGRLTYTLRCIDFLLFFSIIIGYWWKNQLYINNSIRIICKFNSEKIQNNIKYFLMNWIIRLVFYGLNLSRLGLM